MRGITHFFIGLWAMPWYARLWVALGLIVPNGIFPLAFLDLRIAQITLGVFSVGALGMFILTHRCGFTRILGAGHFLWFALLPYLALHLPDHPSNTTIGLWLRVVIACNALSLVIDVADVVRYLRGDRAPLVDPPRLQAIE